MTTNPTARHAALTSGSRIEAQFLAYHSAHPLIYKLFKRFAAEARAAGIKRYSARAILERLRWELKTSPQRDGAEYRLNNNYTTYYARMLAAEDARYADFFEFRRLRR